MGFSVPVDGKSVRVSGRLPLLPLRDVVLYPGTTLPLFIGRPASVAAVEMAAASSRRLLFAVAQRRPEVAQPRRGDLYEIGVVACLRQHFRLPDGSMRVLIEGTARARLKNLREHEGALEAELAAGPTEGKPTDETSRLLRTVRAAFLDWARLNRRASGEVPAAISACRDPIEISFRIASALVLQIPFRQELLEAGGPSERLGLLERFLAAELETTPADRGRSAAGLPGALQRKEPPETLNRREIPDPPQASRRRRLWHPEAEDGMEEQAELEEAIQKTRLPEHVEEKVRREMQRLAKMAFLSPEATVARTYIDWLLALPWKRRTRDHVTLGEAERILDEDHFGLRPVKERILEHLAVLQLSRGVKGPVLCLVGPPGVGKTSLGRSVARALGRRFARMSLGGVRDEAEIRGHRRTYIGAMPGRILQAMRRAGTINPVLLLDEVDKLGVDYRGDPAAALLEVLDPEQNVAFNDHYLEIDYDLSKVLFLTTANSAAGIPPALRDRMETIPLPGYLETEKLAIAERFLLPKQRHAAGLEESDLSIRREAILRLVREYTREAGVRGLEREIAGVCRKTARRKAAGDLCAGFDVGAEDVESLLGIPRFQELRLVRRDRVGLATGLAWSETGGSVLQIEIGVLPGRGKLLLTGRLGATMRESARAALSCVRAQAPKLGIECDFFRRVDIHVHIPEGEVPKDGPSAGAAIALGIVSALTGRPTRESVALSGELTLRGQVLPVGGLAEKTLAALRAGVRTVLIPAANRRNIADLPEEVRAGIRFIPVASVGEVLRRGLVRERKRPDVPERIGNEDADDGSIPARAANL